MQTELPALANLQEAAATLRQQGSVLVLLVSRSDCAYCREVRLHYLLPLARSEAGRPWLIRELESDQVSSLRQLDGSSVSVKEWLKRMHVNFFPTVLFLDAAMQPLAEPLRGLDQAGFYGAYLEQRLQQAAAAKGR